MQYLSIITAILPFLLFNAQAACPPGSKSVEDPAGSGNFRCETITWTCDGGDARSYVSSVSNADLCCPPSQDLVIYDKNTRVGVCCGPDQSYAGIAPNGKCCPKGQILSTDGKCIVPPGGNCPSCPNQPTGACRLQLACGDSTTTNGLKYGSCYQMTFPNTNGAQLGREPDGTYISEGHIQNIVYKICQSATGACGTGPVKPTDAFYIEDDVGPAMDTNGAKSWILTTIAVNLLLTPPQLLNSPASQAITITTDASKAAQFKGTTSCSSCACVIALTGVGKGMGYIGDRPDQPEIAFYTNPKIALDMQFAEVPCDGIFNFPPQN
ncbi:hypothetical protein V5O48_010642 [Marasmius crinis-equi]|uniref:Uncharacterized protein n=1 Tax=Marasmius crinis-equi TaxID=585013 RepID=A0ABR3F7T8_9AGAR